MEPPRQSPTLAEADDKGMLSTYMGVVRPAMCDGEGFMATRAYMGVVSDSVPNLVAQIRGEDRSQSGIGGAALEYRFVYRDTPRAGDIIVLRTGIKDVANKAYTFCHWMFDRVTGEAVATAEAVAVALDLEERRAISIPDGMRAGLERAVVPGLSV
jgi:acyl-CoA thioester hydrolase